MMHGWDPHKPQKMQCLLPLLIISHYHQDNSCCWWLNPIVIPLHRCSLSMAHLVSLHGLWDPLSATWARSARFQSLSSFSPGAMRYHSPPCQQLDHPWNMENPFFQHREEALRTGSAGTSTISMPLGRSKWYWKMENAPPRTRRCPDAMWTLVHNLLPSGYD